MPTLANEGTPMTNPANYSNLTPEKVVHFLQTYRSVMEMPEPSSPPQDPTKPGKLWWICGDTPTFLSGNQQKESSIPGLLPPSNAVVIDYHAIRAKHLSQKFDGAEDSFHPINRDEPNEFPLREKTLEDFRQSMGAREDLAHYNSAVQEACIMETKRLMLEGHDVALVLTPGIRDIHRVDRDTGKTQHTGWGIAKSLIEEAPGPMQILAVDDGRHSTSRTESGLPRYLAGVLVSCPRGTYPTVTVVNESGSVEESRTQQVQSYRTSMNNDPTHRRHSWTLSRIGQGQQTQQSTTPKIPSEFQPTFQDVVAGIRGVNATLAQEKMAELEAESLLHIKHTLNARPNTLNARPNTSKTMFDESEGVPGLRSFGGALIAESQRHVALHGSTKPGEILIVRKQTLADLGVPIPSLGKPLQLPPEQGQAQTARKIIGLLQNRLHRRDLWLGVPWNPHVPRCTLRFLWYVRP